MDRKRQRHTCRVCLCAARGFPHFAHNASNASTPTRLRSSSMRYLLKASGIAVALAFTAFAPGAGAQEISKSICQLVGGSGALEPLGDREGHAIEVAIET